MKVKTIFKNPEAEQYGQFVSFKPYPSKNQVCQAKLFLRESIRLFEKKIKKRAGPITWIVHDRYKDDNGDSTGVVGWKADFTGDKTMKPKKPKC